MQRLNRSITSDGVDYHPGTPVSDLPPRIRGSVVEAGWTDDAPAEPSARKSASPRPAAGSLSPTPTSPRPAAGRGAGGEGPTDPPAPSDPAPTDPPADPAPPTAPKPRPSRAKPKT
jgi:hypothetical protein